MSVSCSAVTGIGGWNIRVDTATCPGSAPVDCGTGLQVRCCPSGTTCEGATSNICCPKGTKCADTIYDAAICADPSWTLWRKPGIISSSNGAWCCQSGYAGLYTSGGVLCLAAGSVPSGASVAVQTTQTSTCSTSSTRTTASSSSITSSSAVITSSSSSSTSSSQSIQTGASSSSSANSGAKSSSSSTLGIALGVSLGVLAILLVIAFIFFRRRRRASKRNTDDSGSGRAWLAGSPSDPPDFAYKDNSGISSERKGRTGSVVELSAENGNRNEIHELQTTSHTHVWSPPGRVELE